MTLTTPIEILEYEVKDIIKSIDNILQTLHTEDIDETERLELERIVMLLNMDKVQIIEAIKILENS